MQTRHLVSWAVDKTDHPVHDVSPPPPRPSCHASDRIQPTTLGRDWRSLMRQVKINDALLSSLPPLPPPPPPPPPPLPVAAKSLVQRPAQYLNRIFFFSNPQRLKHKAPHFRCFVTLVRTRAGIPFTTCGIFYLHGMCRYVLFAYTFRFLEFFSTYVCVTTNLKIRCR